MTPTIPEAVQADKTLWCVNIKGPDDIISVPDHLSAVRMANTFNAWWLDLITKTPLTDNHPRMWAEPIEWPYSEGHGEDVTDPNNEYQWLRELSSSPNYSKTKTIRPIIDFLEADAENIHHLNPADVEILRTFFAQAPSPRAQALEEILRELKEAERKIFSWSGSAFVANELEGAEDADCKSELYNDLCKLGNVMSWLQTQVSALSHPVSPDMGVERPVEGGWSIETAKRAQALAVSLRQCSIFVVADVGKHIAKSMTDAAEFLEALPQAPGVAV